MPSFLADGINVKALTLCIAIFILLIEESSLWINSHCDPNQVHSERYKAYKTGVNQSCNATKLSYLKLSNQMVAQSHKL